jgi:hypothetical protein
MLVVCHGGHLARGRGDVGSKPCPQREVVGVETEKVGLECCPDGGEGTGGKPPPLNLNPRKRWKERRGK